DDAAACVRALGFPDPDQIIDDSIRILGEGSMAWSAPHNEDLREWIRPDVEYILSATRDGAGRWGQQGTAKAEPTPTRPHARFPELQGIKVDRYGLSDEKPEQSSEHNDPEFS